MNTRSLAVIAAHMAYVNTDLAPHIATPDGGFDYTIALRGLDGAQVEMQLDDISNAELGVLLFAISVAYDELDLPAHMLAMALNLANPATLLGQWLETCGDTYYNF